MEKFELKELLKNNGYPDFMIENTIEKILQFQEPIENAFNIWCLNGSIPDMEIEGFSYRTLLYDFEMNPIGAFITLDWLQRDPINAEKSLSRGFDEIR